MKVLIVCSGNYPEPSRNFEINQAFVSEQVKILKKCYDVQFEIFLVLGKSFFGYLTNLKLLRKEIAEGDYSIIHAHYGLSGLLAAAAKKSQLPLIITFHGSDINNLKTRLISAFASIFAKHLIFVSQRLRDKLSFFSSKSTVIPCGVDLDVFYPESTEKCRNEEHLNIKKKYILFSASFENSVKNYSLAQKAINLLNTEAEVLELKERSRNQVRTILNASDVLLLTSFSEGSPQVIKEAMACNCPIVSVDVGDVREVMGTAEQCFLTEHDPVEISRCLNMVLRKGLRSNGRTHIEKYNNKLIADRVFEVYKKVLEKETFPIIL